jgi:hypothetical protein
MAATRAIPLNTSATSVEYKNFLTDTALAPGDWVELTAAGKVQKANKSSYNRIVGVAMKTVNAGSLQTTQIQVKGTVVKAGWSFGSVGQPVYIGTDGNVTQSIVGFAPTDVLIEVGLALGANQILIDMKTPILYQVSQNGALAVASSVIYAELAKKVTRDLNDAAVGTGQIAVFTLSGALAAAADLTLPPEGGQILTNRSTIVGVDYS